MKTNILILSILCILGSKGNLSAQAGGNYLYESNDHYGNDKYPKTNQNNLSDFGAVFLNDSTIELRTKILMNVLPDSHLAIFSVSQDGDNLENTHRFMNQRIQGFIKDLATLGIDSTRIHLDVISQVPNYEFDVTKKLFSTKYVEVPKGFTFKKNIHIPFKEEAQLNQIMFLAGKNEIYDLAKVEYFVKNISAVYDSMRVIAVEQLNKKVKLINKLGLTVRPMYQTIAENSFASYPESQYSSYTAYESQSIDKSGRSARITNVEKTTTYYYNKYPYNSYEVIVNPEIVQPVVQFSYTLRMKYVLKKL